VNAISPLAQIELLPVVQTVRVVVPVSGGKDSQASLKLALEHYHPSEIRGLFCDTKFEHPKTYEHVAWMSQHYDVTFDSACGGSVEEKVLKYRRFPGGGARHCTEELKIKLTKLYCKWLALLQGEGFEVWYGMRANESHERAKRYAGKVCDEVYAPHEVMKKYPKYLGNLGVMFRLCILDWTECDVKEFVGVQNLNPLYRPPYNMDRVGCFPCLAGGDQWKERAFAADDFGRSQLIKVLQIGEAIGKNVFTSKSGIARNANSGCGVCEV
jgi:3'-phosphoadenosine 5'-phosphosulfate sulfotransferase (PAPS reductase)/FAD synthetase